MQITEAVLHRIDKQPKTPGEKSTVEVEKAPALLAIDTVLTKLCEDLRGLIDRANVGYGTLGDFTDFPARLGSYFKQDCTLMDLSSRAVDLLAHEMQRSNFATGGHALFVRYTYAQKDYMLVAMLKIRTGAGIDEALKLQETLTIDVSKLHEAARVNVTRWQNNEQPYLTFAKGQRQGDVTEYFRRALSCSDYTDSKRQTENAIEAARAFVQQRTDLDEEGKRQEGINMRQRLFQCFDEVGKGEVHPDRLAAVIAPQAPGEFRDFLAKDGIAEKYNLHAPFTPHRATYGRLKRIRGTMGTVHIAFDVEDVANGKVLYDDSRDAIVLMHPGENLKQSIREQQAPE